MNKVILIGRLTADPILRYTPNGAAVCNFTLAVNRPYNPDKQQEADFIEIVVWNKIAENVAKYLQKGRQAGVEGRLQIRSYEDKKGERKWRSEVIASSVEFLGSGEGNKKTSEADEMTKGGYGVEVGFDDRDLPF